MPPNYMKVHICIPNSSNSARECASPFVDVSHFIFLRLISRIFYTHPVYTAR